MFKIENVTSDAKQRQTLVLPDGTQIILSIRFVPMQQGWFITELSYLDFKVCGMRISNNPDILYQYRNQIPFGLACFSPITKREPSLQEDFLSGSSELYILTDAEVDAYTEYLTSG